MIGMSTKMARIEPLGKPSVIPTINSAINWKKPISETFTRPEIGYLGSAEGRARTGTGFPPLPPQDSVSTSSTTSAFILLIAS